jgi:uncharacterized protein YciI
MKHFIILLTYTKPLEEIDKFLVEHRSYLDEGYKNSVLLASGPQNPRNGGVLIGKAESLLKMKEFCSQDPFSINQCAEYQLIEFIPVKYQSDFKNWFA